MKIAHIELPNNVFLAPMAGVTDLPMRILCREMGAGLAISEMVASQPQLRDTRKSELRLKKDGEPYPISVQLLGNDPAQMRDAAQFNEAEGADIIDINFGCPAKKVTRKAAGSALLGEAQLMSDIIRAVVDAVGVPVTIKMRTGLTPDTRNAVELAKMAQDQGVQAIAMHGRTRACLYKGQAEFDTIKTVKQAIQIPLIANGDITTPHQAQQVLKDTQADAIMIGRGAMGNPWLFPATLAYLNGQTYTRPAFEAQIQTVLEHLQAIHIHYGERQGVRVARKHIQAYMNTLNVSPEMRKAFNPLNSSKEQIHFIENLNA